MQLLDQQNTSSNIQEAEQFLSTVTQGQIKQNLGFTFTSDFETLRLHQNMFVDKSLFIKQVIDNSLQWPTLIMRPRRWGKSCNLSMLKYFFEKVTDQNGKKLQNNPFKNLFTGGQYTYRTKKIYLQKLKITALNNWNKYQVHQELYPVVSVNFLVGDISTFNQMKQIILKEIINEYCRHNYMKDNIDYLSKLQLLNQQLKKLINNDSLKNYSNNVQIQYSLSQLCTFLKKFHGISPIVLIDQYDSFYCFIKDDAQRNKAQTFVSNILLSIGKKDSTLYSLYVLTGCLDLTLRKGNSNHNNLMRNYFFNQPYATSFGFLQDKNFKIILKQKINHCQCNEGYKKWYNGYSTQLKADRPKIYNPYSVICFLKNFCKFTNKSEAAKSYWPERSSSQLLKTILSSSLNIPKLMKLIPLNNDNQQTGFIFSNKVSFKFHQDFRLSIKGQEDQQTDIQNLNENIVSYLLVSLGYLTGTLNKKKKELIACFPNLQIKKCMFPQLLKQCINLKQSKKEINENLLSNFFDIEQSEEMKKQLESFINQYTSSIKVFNQATCAGFLFFYFIKNQNKNYKFSTEEKSGQGIINFAVTPTDQSGKNTATIFQLKFTKDMSKDFQIYDEALTQIYSKNYMEAVIKYSSYHPKIKNIKVKPIVFIFEQNQNKIRVHMPLGLTHTVQQAEKICLIIKEINQNHGKNQKKLKNINYKETLAKIYKVQSVKQIFQKISINVKKQVGRQKLWYSEIIKNLHLRKYMLGTRRTKQQVFTQKFKRFKDLTTCTTQKIVQIGFGQQQAQSILKHLLELLKRIQEKDYAIQNKTTSIQQASLIND